MDTFESDDGGYERDEYEDLGIASASSEDEALPVAVKAPTKRDVGYGSEDDEYGDALEGSSSEGDTASGSEEGSEEEDVVAPAKKASRARSVSLTSPREAAGKAAPAPSVRAPPARAALPSAPRPQATRFSFYPGEQKSHAQIVEQATEAARAAFPNDPNPHILGMCVLDKALYGHSYIPAVEVKLVAVISRMSM